MDAKYLYTLKTIVDEGSFNNAASKLGYTQSTITFQIKQLEQEFGITLFEKIGRKMVLTQAGNSIMPYVLETIESYEKIKSFGKDISKLDGELSIILSETLFCYKMKEVIKAFHEKAPNIKLKMRSLDCHATKQALIEGLADVGICYDESEIDNRLIINPLSHCKMTLVASRELVDKMGLEALDFTKNNQQIETSFITDEPNGIFRLDFEEYLMKRNISMQSTIELWSTETIKSMVLAGLGVAYLPDFVARENIEKGTMVELQHMIPYEQIRIICSYHKNKYITPQMQLLLELIQENKWT